MAHRQKDLQDTALMLGWQDPLRSAQVLFLFGGHTVNRGMTMSSSGPAQCPLGTEGQAVIFVGG